jgi:hypothetical protein
MPAGFAGYTGPETFHAHMPKSHPRRRTHIRRTEEEGTFAAKVGECVSRAGRPRPAHEYDRDGVCIYCDAKAQ